MNTKIKLIVLGFILAICLAATGDSVVEIKPGTQKMIVCVDGQYPQVIDSDSPNILVGCPAAAK